MANFPVILFAVVAGSMQQTPMRDMAACTTTFINMPAREAFSAKCVDTGSGKTVYARDGVRVGVQHGALGDRERPRRWGASGSEKPPLSGSNPDAPTYRLDDHADKERNI